MRLREDITNCHYSLVQLLAAHKMTHNSLFYNKALSHFQGMMYRTFEIHEDTVATQSPLACIRTAAPNPMDPPVDIKTAMDKATVKEDEEAILDSNPPEPSPRSKIRRNKFAEYKDSDLPDTEARLTDDQISLLFSTRPDVRKRYTRYFRANGQISTNLMRLLFERDESGNLRHSEDIIRSNVQNWQKTLLGYENPDKFTKKGEPRSYGDNEEKITRKRRRPFEDDTAESSSQPALKAIRDHTPVVDSSSLQRPNAGAPANSPISNHHQLCAESQTPLRYAVKPPFTELEPPDSYLHRPKIRLFAHVTSALIEVLEKLEIGDHSSLTKVDLMLVTEWIGRQSLTLQEIVSRSLWVKMPPEPRYILFDLQDELSRASRICTTFDQEVQFAYRESDDCLETD